MEINKKNANRVYNANYNMITKTMMTILTVIAKITNISKSDNVFNIYNMTYDII